MLEELILVLRFVRHRLRHGDIENKGNRTERCQNHQRTRIGYQASVVLGPTLTRQHILRTRALHLDQHGVV